MSPKIIHFSSAMALLAMSVPAAIPVRAQTTFHNNERIRLECLGTRPGNKFLDGHTHDGTVALAPTFGNQFTGTHWRAHSAGGHFWRLENLGKIPGPAVWLDGRTDFEKLRIPPVGLAPHTKAPFTGATWEIIQLSEETSGKGTYTLRSLGDKPGPGFLDCHTADGTVGLAPNTQVPPFSGTRWAIQAETCFDESSC